ncbi:zinc ribbon domain-containing protein [Haloferula sp.]|uniref:zinc ribbon domain-containing protein n=1 Tax=Haloferula sp. TaxID=2497595 RepID=UPI003C74C9DD
MMSERSEREWGMTTYVYETIPQNADEVPVRFEVKQGMNDPKLTEQPGTGKPVRRLVSGGFALLREPLQSVGSVTDPSFHQRD